jgi:hypothetical protein
MATTKIKVLNKQQANSIKGQSDKKQVPVKQFVTDPEAPPLTPYQLTQFKPFILVKKRLGL